MLLIWALLSSAIVGLTRAQGEPCSNTLNGQPGMCVSIYNCSSVVLVLREQQPLSQDVIKRLQSAQCGFQGTTPKVCCADHLPLPPKQTTARPPTRPSNRPTNRPPPTKPSVGVAGTTTSTVRPNPASVLQRVNVGPKHPKIHLLPFDLCGVSTADRIVNGKKAALNQLPWMARLGYETRFGESYRCGGSVLSKRYVLTAAHCMTKLPNGLKLISVLLGELNANQEIDCDFLNPTVCNPPPQSFRVAEAIPHPQYSPTTVQNDIGIIRLDRDADLTTDAVRPICLPIGNIQFKDLNRVKAFTVAGWGTTEQGSSSQELLYADVPPVSNQLCKDAYVRQAQIIDSQICAGGQSQDSCDGDSGGPLMVPDAVHGDPAPRSVQVGIVSFGPVRCGTKDMPGVYTRVGYYVSWILENMRP
ncbi:phenoloxidase-activating enzyme 1-like [Cloeon dipterum]|uniref:phenoloxidase-activating enzyme 1-like n=1 Tax=Cloeon dipterum TaxID=197152 RepID=UPI00321F92DB